MGTAKRQIQSEEEREKVVAAARALVAQGGVEKFSLTRLSAETGVARGTLHRRFGGKQALLAAILADDLTALSGIMHSSAGESAPAAPAPEASAATNPQPEIDAWLERRLRVFERALGTIENHQEKFEHHLTALADLDQTLQGFDRRLALAEARIETAVQEAVAAREAAPRPFERVRLAHLADARAPEPQLPFHAPQPVESVEPTEQVVSALDSPVMRESFIAEARRVAQAAIAVEEPPKRKTVSPWLFAIALLALFVIIGTTLLKYSAPAVAAQSGTAHRRVALSPDENLVARADNGDAGAQYLLGTRYLESDPRAALRWLAAAAAQGNRKAMHNLGVAYALGKGMAPDPTAAARWFAHAAALGYVDSAFDLAVLYERGEGVPQSLMDACKWYLIAASAGDAQSAERADALRTQMPQADFAAARAAAAAFAPPESKARPGI